jgi:hypothetical protein
LNGADGPQVDQRLGWDVLGLEIRAVLDFGCGVNDYRGTYSGATGTDRTRRRTARLRQR